MDDATDVEHGGDHHHQQQQANKIQVSNSKKPLFFYVNLAKQFLGRHETVLLSGLGMGECTSLQRAGSAVTQPAGCRYLLAPLVPFGPPPCYLDA